MAQEEKASKENTRKSGKNHALAKSEVSESDIDNGRAMAVVSYVIALIPYFAGDKKNKFVRFHAVQGMNIFIACLVLWVAWWLISAMFFGFFGIGFLFVWGILFAIVWILSAVLAIVDIIGLIYAVQGQMKEVPIFDKLKFIQK